MEKKAMTRKSKVEKASRSLDEMMEKLKPFLPPHVRAQEEEKREWKLVSASVHLHQ